MAGLLPLEEVAQEYLKFCIEYDNSVANTKFMLGKMYKYNGDNLMNKKFNRDFEAAESLVQICKFWNLKEYCQKKHAIYDAMGLTHLRCSPVTRLEDVPNEILEYRKSLYKEESIMFVLMRFQRKYFGSDTLPKVLLLKYVMTIILHNYVTDFFGFSRSYFMDMLVEIIYRSQHMKQGEKIACSIL